LKSQQKEKVAAAFVTLRYHKGQNIIQEGDPGSSFYLIKKGTAALIRGNVEERKLYKGESFGHHSLYYNTMRKMTVQAEEEVVCQVLGRATLAEIIGRDFREVMFRNYAKHVIQKHKKLYSIMRKDEEAFFEGMRVLYKRNNEVVFYKGKTVERLLVLMEGRLKKYRAEHALVETGQIWGESYLSEGFNNRLEDDIIVDVESIIIDLDLLKIKAIKDSHESILTDKSEEVIR
jgi:cGMP-dependent protein kinase